MCIIMFLREFFVVAWIVWTLPFRRISLTLLVCFLGAHYADTTPLVTLPLALYGQITWTQALENMLGQLLAVAFALTVMYSGNRSAS